MFPLRIKPFYYLNELIASYVHTPKVCSSTETLYIATLPVHTLLKIFDILLNCKILCNQLNDYVVLM